ncbi:hypothetical protein TSAR_004569 [Trichomalopsis sarcophagae]|uniref:Uncharacterized protein n=1 Tax=Trichomalopsis sarcophagae TaxID=543379 RepID=A0A232EUN4_9HYME|nr:hypothetical protein TSAR_004569 [Trichomalopsis sarcophagae]
MTTMMCNLNLYIDEYILYIVKDLCDINVDESEARRGKRIDWLSCAPTRIECSALANRRAEMTGSYCESHKYASRISGKGLSRKRSSPIERPMI